MKNENQANEFATLLREARQISQYKTMWGLRICPWKGSEFFCFKFEKYSL